MCNNNYNIPTQNIITGIGLGVSVYIYHLVKYIWRRK
jgi:hypothetical protein